MKKSILWLPALAGLMYACGSPSTTTSETTANAPTVEGVAPKAGDVLIASSDCSGCHAQDQKLVGPSYKEIAAKYPATDENIASLAKSIINGGSGKWGDVPMTPHTDMPEDEAKAIAKFILSPAK